MLHRYHCVPTSKDVSGQLMISAVQIYIQFFAMEGGTRQDVKMADTDKGSDAQEMGLGLEHCPVYRPTEEEFQNPLEYIARVRPEAEKYGICKIVPPSSWSPPFMVDTDNFSFDTRIQSVNELQNKISSTPEYKAWNSKWLEFLKALGKERKRNPTFCSREIDLYKFHRLVEKRGGYQAVCDKKLWREVARLLGVCLHHCASRAGLYRVLANYTIT
jgi:hypothetical protein